MTELQRKVDINTLPPTDKAKRLYGKLKTVCNMPRSSVGNLYLEVEFEAFADDLIADKQFNQFMGSRVVGFDFEGIGSVNYHQNIAYMYRDGQQLYFHRLPQRDELMTQFPQNTVVTMKDVCSYIGRLDPINYSEAQLLSTFGAASSSN